MLGSIFHLMRLARAGYVLAREGVFANVDPALAPPASPPPPSSTAVEGVIAGSTSNRQTEIAASTMMDQ